MSVNFSNKVRGIVLNHLDDEGFNTRKLASEIGYSRSYIYRKIRCATGKSVNEYVKNIRLHESVKLIKEEKYTAAEIAFKVGFHSPSYFNKCFKVRYGITPGEVKDKIDDEILPIQTTNKFKIKRGKKKIFIFLSLSLIALLIFVGYYVLASTSQVNINSIAVIPFDNFSKDIKTDESVENGTDEIKESRSDEFRMSLTYDIISQLSKLSKFKISPRHSSKKYKDSEKTINEIAKELKVNYLIEGLIHIKNDSILIYVELIRAKDNLAVWRKSYNKEFIDQLHFSTSLAQEISKDISIPLESEVAFNKLTRRKYFIFEQNRVCLQYSGFHNHLNPETKNV